MAQIRVLAGNGKVFDIEDSDLPWLNDRLRAGGNPPLQPLKLGPPQADWPGMKEQPQEVPMRQDAPSIGPITPEHARAAVNADIARKEHEQAVGRVTSTIPSAIAGAASNFLPLGDEFTRGAEEASPTAYKVGEFAPLMYGGMKAGAGLAGSLAGKIKESALRAAMKGMPKEIADALGSDPEMAIKYLGKATGPGQALKDVAPAAGTVAAGQVFGYGNPLTYMMFGWPHRQLARVAESPAVWTQASRPLPFLGGAAGAGVGAGLRSFLRPEDEGK